MPRGTYGRSRLCLFVHTHPPTLDAASEIFASRDVKKFPAEFWRDTSTCDSGQHFLHQYL
eukprot:1156056-Pelagomonas_calceolata.AAC.6